MALFNLRGMGSNLWNLAKWGMTGSRAAPWLKGGAALLGAGGLLGMINPNRSMFGGMGTTAGSTIRGTMIGGFGGALGGAAVGALGAYRGASPLRGILSVGLAGARRWGARGTVYGAALGAGFGLLKAGIGANRPVNRIRGLHQ